MITSNVFLTWPEWLVMLRGFRAALRPGGCLVFESADPAGQPGQGWDRVGRRSRRRIS